MIYRDDRGRPSKHTFDALVVMTSGQRVAVDVKPRAKVERSEIMTVQRLIKEQVGSAFADQYVVRTEDHIHPDDVWDARLILRAFRLVCDVADSSLAALLPSLRSWCRLSDLIAATSLEATAFNAVVRLIGHGKMEVRDSSRISRDCFIRRTST